MGSYTRLGGIRNSWPEFLQKTAADSWSDSGPFGPRQVTPTTPINTVYALMTSGMAAELVLIDRDSRRAEGLNCAHFRTDASFLDVHKEELRETERVIEKAKINGWTREIEMNEQKRQPGAHQQHS